MYEIIRMHIIASNILLENSPDPKQLISYLVASNISLLRELGVVSLNVEYTDLAHITGEAAIQSDWLDDAGKSHIYSLLNNERD